MNKTAAKTPHTPQDTKDFSHELHTIFAQELAGGNTICRSKLIEVLHRIMQQCGCIPSSAIAQLAQVCNITQAEVYGVISFYDDFSLSDTLDCATLSLPVVHVCRAEACQAVGGRELFRTLASTLATKATIKSVYCLGNCALAPTVMIDGKCIGKANHTRIQSVLLANKKIH